MSNPNATNFWLPVNKAAWKTPVSDLLSKGQVSVPTGCALQFNFAFSDGPFIDANILDLSNYSSIRFTIMDPLLQNAFIDITIDNGSFETCTVETFQAMTAQQISIFIPAAQNILTTSNGAPGNYILRVYGVDADAASDPDILYLAQITAYNTGISADPQSPLPTKVGSKLSFVCSWDNMTRDLIFVKTPNNQISWQISAPYNGPGQASYAMQWTAANGGDNLYHDISLVNDSGEPTLSINPAGHS